MKQITIDDLIPLLKKGWVAMDENGRWGWYEKKPQIDYDILSYRGYWTNAYGETHSKREMFDGFKIKRHRAWQDSLRRVK